MKIDLRPEPTVNHTRGFAIGLYYNWLTANINLGVLKLKGGQSLSQLCFLIFSFIPYIELTLLKYLMPFIKYPNIIFAKMR